MFDANFPLSVRLALVLAGAIVVVWALTTLQLRNDRRPEAVDPLRGGVWVVVAIVVLGLLSAWRDVAVALVVLGAASGLALIEWMHRHWRLWPITRLSAQILAISAMFSLLPNDLRLLPAVVTAHMGRELELALLGLLWLGWIQASRGLDGVPGLAAVQGLAIGLGVAGALWASGDLVGATSAHSVAVLLAGACLGHLLATRFSGRMNLGPPGATALGFLTGALLLELAQRGYAGPAIALSACLLIDASWSALRSLLVGQPPWLTNSHQTIIRARAAGASPRTIALWWGLAALAAIAVSSWLGHSPLLAAVSSGLLAVGWLLVGATLARSRAHPPGPAPSSGLFAPSESD